MDNDIIGKAIDEVHLKTLKAVVEWLEKYPVKTVIETVKEEIERLEKKAAETKKIICGYCYYDQGTHNPDGSCPYMKGSSKDLDGTFAPDSTPLEIDTKDWWKGKDGRYTHKP